MKPLNKQTVELLNILIQKKTIHALRAKVLHDCGRHRIIQVIHYRFEGDWHFREPELTIIHDTRSDEYIPSNYCNDYARINSNSASIYNGKLTVWNDNIQADHTDYTHRFFEQMEELIRNGE